MSDKDKSGSQRDPSKLKKLQFLVFSTMFIGYACYGYTRKGVSLALPKLMEEGLRKEEAGLIISCQNIAYAISKFLGGILSDKLSARHLFSSGLLAAGAATILFGTVDSLTLFCVFWFLNGFAQGCGWPSCAKIIRQWYHPSQFGTWWSVLSASTNVSGGVAPFVSTFIILSYGWRYSLFVAGGISLCLGVISLFTLFNSPTDLGYPSFLSNVKKDDDNKAKSTPPGGIRDVLASPFLWLLSFGYAVTFLIKTASVDWGQVYLMEDLKQSVYVGSTFTSCLESGGFFGGIAAGMFTDAIVKRHDKKLHYSPRLPAAFVFATLISICLYFLTTWITPSTPATFIASTGFMLGAFCYANIALFGIMASEASPIHLSGSSHAIAALAGNVGAIISGLPLSLLAAKVGWSSSFLALGLLNGVVAATMLTCLRMDSRIARHLHND